MFQIENKGIGSDMRNPELFDEIFRHYSTSLFYYACKFVDDEAARDIVQDIFVKLWSDEKLSIKLSLNALLFTMVRNSCLQQLEKQKVRNKYLESNKLLLQEEELHFYIEEKSSLIEQEVENKLNEVLNVLPDRCRQIFVMSRFENKKNKAIAEELDISVKAVEKQITRALSTIRTELKDFLPLLIYLSAFWFKN
jgi:RNA polymerase sigma-70 factor (ECF subfamily)